MSDIQLAGTTKNMFFGRVTISLGPHWDSFIPTSGTNMFKELYAEWAEMRKVLDGINGHYHFKWLHGGAYVPDYVVLDEESAIIFKLKFGL
jgi:hypothetical protein